MRTVVLTGKIGSGKSYVAGIFASYGVPLYDCDNAAKSLYDRDGTLLDAVEDAVGRKLRTDSGSLDRKALAAAIFSDRVACSKVEDLVHPAVFEDFARWKSEAVTDGAACNYCLFESALYPMLTPPECFADAVVLVRADESLRRARLALRNPGENLDLRIRMQDAGWPEVFESDYVIDNNGDDTALRACIGNIDKYLKLL